MIIDCLGNGSLNGTMKLVWILVILVLPLLGPILYLLLARGGGRPVI